jgi:hypothetical protein
LKIRKSPKIICLCGSTRFIDKFHEINLVETLKGNIVLSVGAIARTADGHLNPMVTDDVKTKLDVLHFRKIDLADEVLILNVSGYIGDSTRREIAYAHSIGVGVRYLEC